MSTRKIAVEILETFENQSVGIESVISQKLLNSKIDHRDRRLLYEIVYGVIRNKLTLDYVLHTFLNNEQFKDNKQLMRILRIGMYQIVYLDKIPDHAAVNESVVLAKAENRTQKFSGVINAVLRKIIKTKRRLPRPNETDELLYRLSINYSHPQWLVQRFLEHFGLARTKKLLTFFNRPPAIFLRRKIRGLSRQQFEIDAQSICDTTSGGKGFRNLYYRLKKNIAPDDIFLLQDGHCTVQADSSGWVVALLDCKKDDKVLDVCSAPGGKTTLMSELVGDSGAICACDINMSRLKKMNENSWRMRQANVHPLVCDGTSLPFNGSYDKVLLDAPCSGTGVMHRHPDARWSRSLVDIDRVVMLQKKLLDEVVSYIVPGGVLVYATCSLEPQENELQIETFVKEHPEFQIEKANGFIPDTYVDKNGYLSISPFEHSMDGMFAVRLIKKA